MTKYNTLILLSVLVGLISCSDSDDSTSTGNEPVVITGDYFPSATNNTWVYSVDNTNSANSDFNFIDAVDSLVVSSATDNPFTVTANNDSGIIYGSMNTFLTNGTLNKTASVLQMNSTFESPFQDLVDLNIMLNNMVLYDLNAAVNSTLYTESGSIDQSIQNIPTTITYTVTTANLGNSDSMTVAGETFTAITASTLTLNLSISVNLEVAGQTTSLPILSNQDVLVATNYFAENVGLIKSETQTNYQIDANTISLLELAGITLPFATQSSGTNTQELESYTVSLD